MNHTSTLQKAELLLSSGRYDKLTALVLPVCASSDRDEQEKAYTLLIRVALLEEDSRRAIEFSSKALEAGLDTVAVRICAAMTYQEAELYLQALKHLQVAVQQAPESSAVHEALAQSYYNLERYEIAEHYGRRAVELAPEDGYPLALLAAIQHNKGYPKGALVLIDKALALAPTDNEILSMRGELEKNSEKSTQLLKRVLNNNPEHRQAAKEYRKLTKRRINQGDWLLFGAYTLLSLTLQLFPQLTDVPCPRSYLWLYLPAAWVLGRNWHLSLPFFLLNCGLLSLVNGGAFVKWSPFSVLVVSLIFTAEFRLLRFIIDWCANRGRNISASFKLHWHQGTIKAKLLEQLDELVNLDSTLVLLGSCSVCLTTLEWLPGWVSWFGLLPLLILVIYRGHKGWAICTAMAPLFYGDLAIFLFLTFIAPTLAIGPVVVIMLLQLYMVHRLYLGKVRYAYTGK
jgi:tetratricopeptide (TPR) repeat protein